MTDLSKIKSQIKKLLALGNDDGATDAEAENALRFARALMLKHNVNEEDIERLDPHAAAGRAEREEYSRREVFTGGAKHSLWETTLGQAIATLVGTVKFYMVPHAVTVKTAHGTIVYDGEGKPKQAVRFVFYGPTDDVLDATELFSEWQVTIAALARMRFGGVYRGVGRNYCEGFTEGMLEKIRAMQAAETQQIAAGSSSALVLHNAHLVMAAKQTQATRWLQQTVGVKLGKTTLGYGSHDSNAYGQGRADGSRANVTRTTTKKIGS